MSAKRKLQRRPILRLGNQQYLHLLELGAKPKLAARIALDFIQTLLPLVRRETLTHAFSRYRKEQQDKTKARRAYLEAQLKDINSELAAVVAEESSWK